jgi:O-antigen/teichoic acid export membrane protein
VLKSNFFKNARTLTVGSLIAQGIGILVTPLLARFFTPSDFGTFSIFTAVSNITAAIVTLSYPVRLVLPQPESEAKKLALLSIVITILVGFFCLILSLFLPKSFLILASLFSLGIWLQIAIINGMISALITVFTYWFNRQEQYFKISKLKIGQTLIVAIFGVAFGFLSINSGLILSQLMGLSIILIFYFYWSRLKFSFNDLQGIFGIFKTHNSAFKYLLPTTILDVFTMQLPFFLITMWFSNDAVGQYRMAFTFLSIPSSLVGFAISQVFYQRFCQIWPDVNAARSLLIRTWFILTLIGVIPFFLVIAYGEPLFEIILGDQWSMSGKIASILAFMSFFSLLHSPTSTTLHSMGYEKLLPVFGLATLFHRPLALYIGYLYNDLFFGIQLFVIFEILHIVIFQLVVLRIFNKIQH